MITCTARLRSGIDESKQARLPSINHHLRNDKQVTRLTAGLDQASERRE